MITLFRDDDINKYSDISILLEIQSIFNHYNKVHTVAVEMEGLWESKDIWYWLRMENNLEICLHGWKHEDYSVKTKYEIRNDIKNSLDYWHNHGKEGGYTRKEITRFLPPWNRISTNLQEVCDEFGLILDNRVGGEVYNFHWWEFIYKSKYDTLRELLRENTVG